MKTGMRYVRKRYVSVLIALTLLAPLPAAAAGEAGTVMLVFDASGSMWGQIGGTAKIEIAREVIGDLLAGWDEEIGLGLIA
jgi:Ca-activated chloride channel family protein